MRRGYTTGSCAAAAAKACAVMLLEGRRLETVSLLTPSEIWLTLPVCEPHFGEGFVSCGIVKDSGDDPDVTNGITIFARVEKTPRRGEIHIDGGEGIGRVTRPGLDQPVGNAAINSIPRLQIGKALSEVLEDTGYEGGLLVTIYAPKGEEVAKKTFNPRLGIVGGISILGTTGIVEPMSDEAVVETIRTELSMRAAEGLKTVLFVPGNYGLSFVRSTLGLLQAAPVQISNFVGDALAAAAEFGFSGALLVGHIGKLVKVAGGIFNTHSRYGDCRMEILAAHAGLCGARTPVLRQIMESATTDDMLAILKEQGLLEPVMESVADRLDTHLQGRRLGTMETGAILFSNVHGLLAKTRSADSLLGKIQAARDSFPEA